MKKQIINPIVLLFINGWGINQKYTGNAVLNAKTPNINKLISLYPVTTLSSKEQPSLNLNSAKIETSSSINTEKSTNYSKKSPPNIHLICLIAKPDHINNIKLAISSYKDNIINIHVILDGNKNGLNLITELEKEIKKNATVISISGRFYALDKNNFLNRTKKFYNALTRVDCKEYNTTKEAIEKNYDLSIFDEDFTPSIISNNQDNKSNTINKDSLLIFVNCEDEDTRQIKKIIGKNLNSPSIKTLSSSQSSTSNTLLKTLSTNKLKYLIVANSLSAAELHNYTKDNKHIAPIIPISLDNRNSSSTQNITDKVISTLKQNEYDFIITSYSELDARAHTGNLSRTAQSMEEIDKNIQHLLNEVLERDGTLIITSNYGNAEFMNDPRLDIKNTCHTKNPIPTIIINKKLEGKSINSTELDGLDLSSLTPSGSTENITPTILNLFNLPTPSNIKEKSLL